MRSVTGLAVGELRGRSDPQGVGGAIRETTGQRATAPGRAPLGHTPHTDHGVVLREGVVVLGLQRRLRRPRVPEAAAPEGIRLSAARKRGQHSSGRCKSKGNLTDWGKRYNLALLGR